jgi:hypothetical protein
MEEFGGGCGCGLWLMLSFCCFSCRAETGYSGRWGLEDTQVGKVSCYSSV